MATVEIPILDSIINKHTEVQRHGGSIDMDQLKADIIAREDALADALRMAGMQFGAMPEFVAEVLCEIGLGTPPDEATREMIHQQFHARMEWLQAGYRRQQGEGGDGGLLG